MKKHAPLIIVILVICCFVTTFCTFIGGIGATYYFYYSDSKSVGPTSSSSSSFSSKTSSSQVPTDNVIVTDNTYDTLTELPAEISEAEKLELLTDFEKHFELTLIADNLPAYQAYFGTDLDYVKMSFEHFWDELTEIYGIEVDHEIIVNIYAEWDAYTAENGYINEDAFGYGLAYDSERLEIYEPLSNEYFYAYSFASLISHEMVHIFTAELSFYPGYLPSWFVEGHADNLSLYRFSDYDKTGVTLPDSVADLEAALWDARGEPDEMNDLYIISYFFYGYIEQKYGRQDMFEIIENHSWLNEFGEDYMEYTGGSLEKDYTAFTKVWNTVEAN